MTTPATCSAAPSTSPSPAMTSSPPFLAAVDDHGAPATHPDRQRPRLHRPLRRRPQRLRIPPAPPRHPPEERLAPDTRKPKARSNASTRPCKRWLTARAPATHPRPSCSTSSTQFRDHYNEHRPTPSARTARTPGNRLPRHPQGRTRRPTRHRPLPAPLRPPRHQRQDDASAAPAACTTSASAPPTPANASSPSPTTPHITVTDLDHRRSPLHPPHRARQDLLAQPKQRARPMAGLSRNETHDATHVRHMSRLITGWS